MIRALDVAALAEIATGVALLVVPSFIGEVLLGEMLIGAAIPTARVAGLALIALGIACWRNAPLLGMLTYSMAATAYLGYVAAAGVFAGVLLWPAVAAHAVLSVFLCRDWLKTDID
ncbi:hypothetical protein IB238_09820 [Rhizobium sp. ARZ01]|uniref:hypothetical protein n=1 Tax=Rhizobium sp. ARZ01 TaxID=2769313 RepID=UPI001782D6B2|nr:hypothetical protein [Rhizobium sp. ARZ01]MBD9372913.1 hypothetical protein [Rhizobium sp. ARZ01]